MVDVTTDVRVGTGSDRVHSGTQDTVSGGKDGDGESYHLGRRWTGPETSGESFGPFPSPYDPRYRF